MKSYIVTYQAVGGERTLYLTAEGFKVTGHSGVIFYIAGKKAGYIPHVLSVVVNP
jgi:hypothetical protein